MSFFENTQGEELQNSLWVEKYRPTKLDNYIGNSHLKEKVSNYLKSGDVPHLLFLEKLVRVKQLWLNLLLNL